MIWAKHMQIWNWICYFVSAIIEVMFKNTLLLLPSFFRLSPSDPLAFPHRLAWPSGRKPLVLRVLSWCLFVCLRKWFCHQVSPVVSMDSRKFEQKGVNISCLCNWPGWQSEILRYWDIEIYKVRRQELLMIATSLESDKIILKGLGLVQASATECWP